MREVITVLDYDRLGCPLLVIEIDGAEVLRLPLDMALGMAHTIISLEEGTH